MYPEMLLQPPIDREDDNEKTRNARELKSIGAKIILMPLTG